MAGPPLKFSSQAKTPSASSEWRMCRNEIPDVHFDSCSPLRLPSPDIFTGAGRWGMFYQECSTVYYGLRARGLPLSKCTRHCHGLIVYQ